MEQMGIGWPDIIIVSAIVISVIIGLMRGLIKESLSLVTWIIAIVLAVLFTQQLAVYMTFTKVEFIRSVVAFFIIFVSVVLIGSIVNFFIGKVVRKTPFSAPDRALGAIFGLLRGVVIVTIMVLLGGLTQIPQVDWWQESTSIQKFEMLAIWAKNRLPEENAKHFKFPDRDGPAKQQEKTEKAETETGANVGKFDKKVGQLNI